MRLLVRFARDAPLVHLNFQGISQAKQTLQKLQRFTSRLIPRASQT